MRQRFFLAFDISDDKRRTKLNKILEKYGVRVQYSFFEFWLTPAMKREFMNELKSKQFLDGLEGESILIMPIPDSFTEKIERYGGTVDIFDQHCIVSI
jgi:CRISPR-associated protein Cas2